MKLSPVGQQLVSGNAAAWAELLQAPVRQVKSSHFHSKWSGARLHKLDIVLQDGHRLSAVVKFDASSEACVYRSLAARLHPDVPKAYYVEDDGRQGVCIIEALPSGKPVTAWNMEDVRLVLSDMARIHATFWRSSELANYRWLPALQDELSARLDKAERGLALMRTIGGWPGVISLDTLRVMEKLLADRSRLLSPLNNLPPTLVHGDTWQPNWVLTGDRRVLLDWQSVTRGPAVWDIVYFQEMSGEGGGRLPLGEAAAYELYLDVLACEMGGTARAHRADFMAAIPAVSVLNVLARWPVYVVDYLSPLERLPALAHVWNHLPHALRRKIETWAAWTDLEYYRQTFARFEERARQVYGV